MYTYRYQNYEEGNDNHDSQDTGYLYWEGGYDQGEAHLVIGSMFQRGKLRYRQEVACPKSYLQ